MKTALFFGSFNPIHNGHIAIAGYILEFTDIEELWFVVSPQNPLKDANELAPDIHRLKMVELSIQGYSNRLKVSDVEMNMPRPSYTIDTLLQLKNTHPDREFAVVMGSDSMDTITLWKDYKDLLHQNRIMVYPRLGSNTESIKQNFKVEVIPAPIVEISSTFIRNSIRAGKSVAYFMPSGAYNYIKANKLYY